METKIIKTRSFFWYQKSTQKLNSSSGIHGQKPIGPGQTKNLRPRTGLGPTKIRKSRISSDRLVRGPSCPWIPTLARSGILNSTRYTERVLIIKFQIPHDFHYCSSSWNGRTCSSWFYCYGIVLDFFSLSWSCCHYATITNDCRNWGSGNNYNTLSFYVGMLQVNFRPSVFFCQKWPFSFRALYLINWIYRYHTENYYDKIVIVAGCVQTVLYLDFFYLYATKGTFTQPLRIDANTYARMPPRAD